MEKKIRESGYYWVRLSDQWNIGYYSERLNTWLFHWPHKAMTDDDLLEISETRIKKAKQRR